VTAAEPAPPSKAKPKPKGKAKAESIRVRRLHRRDLNRTWEFLKLVFRGVNKNTVEYQRPRTKARFMEVYDMEGTDQLLFEVGKQIVGYAECSYTTGGSDNWMNPRYFDKRGMRPLYVDEIAVHPLYQSRGVGSFMLEQLQHLARTRGCTHLVLEVAQNNKQALTWYHKRKFYRLDAAIFLAQRVPMEPELLPERVLKPKLVEAGLADAATNGATAAPRRARRARAPGPPADSLPGESDPTPSSGPGSSRRT
jgi:ribosomal protein S18 acetylase RimI-like enzyme